MIGFCFSVYNFVLLNVDFKIIILRALDLITIAVPPALPATMMVGTTFAIRRLKKWGIFCTSPARVNIFGKVGVMVFDKTGTLTEEGMDVLGVCFVIKNHKEDDPDMFSEMITSVESFNFTCETNQKVSSSGTPKNLSNHLILTAMSTCHSIKLVHGEMIGDPLDLKMFQYTGCIIGETLKSGHISIQPAPNSTYSPEENIEIIKSFEFNSNLRRMSVLTHTRSVSINDKQLYPDNFQVFCKGAPESVFDICKASSFPSDYLKRIDFYTQHGYRVLSIAHKNLKIGMQSIASVTREDCESDLTFIGFIVFENKLKIGTEKVIAVLNRAYIRMIMCTGDNLLTAVSVSRECKLIDPTRQIFAARFVKGNLTDENAIVEWKDIESDKILDNFMFKPISKPGDIVRKDYDLAINGDVFQWMIDFAPDEIFERFLVKCTVYARMSPDQKHFLVENLQMIGYCVGFCGDG